MHQSRAVLSLVLKITITAGLLYVVLRRAGVEGVLEQIRAVSAWWIGMCAAALFAQTALTAVRWRIVLRHLGGAWRFIDLWRFVVIGSFFNQFLPSGMGGDVFRIWYVRNAGISWGRATASVVTDRIMGLLGLFALIAVGAPYLLVVAETGVVRDLLIVLAIGLALSIAAFLWLDLLSGKLKRFPGLNRLLGRSPRMASLFDGVERTSPAIRKMLIARSDGAATLVLSLTNHLIAGAVVFALAHAANADMSLAAAMLLFPFVLLVSMVPVSLAGWGMREGAMVVVFSLVGTPAAGALTVSLLFGISLFLAAAPGGLVWLVSHRAISEESKA